MNKYKFEYEGSTHVGRRAKNEDSFIVFKNEHNFLIAAIADGMGGHKGGETASKAVVKMVKKEFKSFNFSNLSDDAIEEVLLSKVRKFQQELKRIGVEFPDFEDMGSTLNLNIFVEQKIYTINIGDSRTQSFIKKELIKITEDHNLATLAEKDPRFSHFKGQTNMLTSSLGPNKKTTADFFVTDLESNKGYILMTSDGVHNFISDISWMKIIKSSSMKLKDKVNKVIETAYENGSNDNMTFILIKYEV